MAMDWEDRRAYRYNRHRDAPYHHPDQFRSDRPGAAPRRARRYEEDDPRERMSRYEHGYRGDYDEYDDYDDYPGRAHAPDFGRYERSRAGFRRPYGAELYGAGRYGAAGYGMGLGGWPYGAYDARRWDRRDYGGHDYGPDDERSFLDRAGDEVASWFGNEEAEQRRAMDRGHRGRGPKNYTRSDDRIREDVSDRIADDPHVDASALEVSVSDGEVTLDGIVDDRFAKRHTEDIGENVSGVKHLQNNLRTRDRQPEMSRDTAKTGTKTGAAHAAKGKGTSRI